MQFFLGLFLFVVLTACDGKSSSSSSSTSSSSSSGSPLPVITLSDSYAVDENTPFSMPVTVTGVGPFEFQFVYSADAALFNLNALTGELTSKAPFDFETPKSVAGANTYSLSLLVTDRNNHAVTKDIRINVLNLDEHELVVDFPIDGANMGAAANKVHVRGRIAESGKTIAAIPPQLGVSVNGVAAVIDPASPSMWIAEVPLPARENQLLIELKNGGRIDGQKSLLLKNMPISINRVTDGRHDFSIDMDLSKHKVYKRSLRDKTNYSLLVSNEQDEFRSCKMFGELNLSKSGVQVAASCQLVGGSEAALVCTIENSVCKILGAAVITNGFLEWADDRHLVYSKSADEIALVDTNTGTTKILSTGQYAITYASYAEVARGMMVVSLEDKGPLSSGWIQFYSFNLQSHIENEAAVQSVTLKEHPNFSGSYGNFALLNNEMYYPYPGGLNVWNLETGTRYSRAIPEIKQEPMFSLNMIHSDGELVVFEREGAFFSYNLTTGEITDLESERFMLGRLELDFGANNKLYMFNSNMQTLGDYDIARGAASTFYPALQSYSEDSEKYYGFIAIDKIRNIVYRANIQGWLGVVPSDSPVVVGYDLSSKANFSVLTTRQIAAQISGEITRLSVRGIALNAEENALLIHVVVFNNPNRQLICSLNLSTKQIKTLFTQPVDATFAEIYMSRFTPSVGGLALAHWGYVTDQNGGGIDLLNFDGQLTQVLKPQEPYYLTNRGVFNSAGTQYFGIGFKRNPQEPDISQTVGELFSIDAITGQGSILASESVGLGLAPGWMEPVYDNNRNLLIDFQFSKLWFVDTVTGDRVLKPIELPVQ